MALFELFTNSRIEIYVQQGPQIQLGEYNHWDKSITFRTLHSESYLKLGAEWLSLDVLTLPIAEIQSSSDLPRELITFQDVSIVYLAMAERRNSVVCSTECKQRFTMVRNPASYTRCVMTVQMEYSYPSHWCLLYDYVTLLQYWKMAFLLFALLVKQQCF